MILYHSCGSIHNIKHLLSMVENRTDDMVYTTPYPQQDYGHFVIKFNAEVSNDTYDQGGVSSWTANVCIPARNIDVNTMEVLDY